MTHHMYIYIKTPLLLEHLWKMIPTPVAPVAKNRKGFTKPGLHLDLRGVEAGRPHPFAHGVSLGHDAHH